MSLRPDAIENAWLNLSRSVADSDFPVATVKLELDSGYGPVRLGMGTDGAPQLLVPTGVGRRLGDGASGRAVRVTNVQYVVDGRKQEFIEIRSTQQHLADVFHRLVDEILRRLASGAAPEQAVTRSIAELRDLLRREVPHTTEFLVGLYGELTLLITLLERNPAAASIWMGPLLQRQDFAGLALCAEVKTSLRRNASVVSISSLDQLDPPSDGRRLVLVHYAIERTGAGGQSIRSLLESAYQLAADPAVLDSVLADTDVSDWRSDSQLDSERFGVVRKHIYRVEDGFPRLGYRAFVGGGPPSGVKNITYALDLAVASGFRVAEDDVPALLDQLAFTA